MKSYGSSALKSRSTTIETPLFVPSAVDWTPHEYQKNAVRFLLQNAVGALFIDMGLGKTSCTLAAIKILIDKKIIKRALIIAPLRVCYSVWPNEVQKWADFNHLRVEILHGPKKDEAIKRDADIYVINPDGLGWLSLENRVKKLGAEMLVVDESSAFKHSNTQRFKLLKYFLNTFRRRYILTGTPAPNGLEDLFGQIYILDGGNALGRYITHYRQEFFMQAGYMGYDWRPKPDAEKRIYERLGKMVLRMAAEDYLELPERIDNIVQVELPPKARKVYMEMELLFLTALANGEVISAPSTAAVGTKLRQIANGAMYRGLEARAEARVHTEEWVEMHSAKLDALEEIMEAQQGKPVLVAYEFEHDADRLRKRFPHATFLADAKGRGIDEIIRQWNAGEILMLCAHPASAGHGLNLQGGGNTVVWFGMTWNLEYYQQFNARVLRQGNEHSHVIIHHIVAKNTIDEAVMKALASKNKTQSALLEALKEYSREL